MNAVAVIVSHTRAERGAVLPWFALILPVLVLFMVFVVDVANWFEHKRHLQMQADAGALAGGAWFLSCPSDGPIVAETRNYAGDPTAPGPDKWNAFGASDPANVHVLINSKDFWNAGGTDFSDGGGPCATSTLDVKITEADVPWFFGLGPNVVPAINARARVQARALAFTKGSLPVSAPDVDPSNVAVAFIDQATGAEIARKTLTNTGTASGLSIWDNTAEPVAVPIDVARIGVRVILSMAGSSTTCGDPFVTCYDTGAPNQGLLYIRGYSASGSGVQPNPPVARDVRLFNGSCTDPYFTSVITTCTVGVSADVDFGVNNPNSVGGALRATLNGVTYDLEYDQPSKRWISRGTAQAPYFAVPTNAGPLAVQLDWAETKGTVGGQTCNNRGGGWANQNPCKGSFGVVQRVFSATDVRSGPIKLAQVWQGGSFWANSFATGTTQDLVVKIGLTPDLRNAKDVNDPIVTLRVVGGSRNQSLDCEPPGYEPSDPPGVSKPTLKLELAYGCAPAYTQNPGLPCPATATDLWATPEPWNCVAIQTGSATNQVAEGLNQRILGDEKASTCTAPNNWSNFPDLDPGDPRILNIFITPYGAFDGSGGGTVPVLKFGSFYITGWTASGGGFRNPCQGNGDDPVPDGNAGNIVGHFIKYVSAINNGGASEELCDLSAFESCVAVLTD